MKPGTTAIEKLKAVKEGLDIINDLPVFAEQGWEKIPDTDRELLKWIGVFFRKRTPGFFMMRIRIPNGQATSAQLRALADIEQRVGNGILDITTRQQIELRSIQIQDVPEILERLRGVDLTSLQTGMDNIRNVNCCALSGLTPHELLDAAPVGLELQKTFLGNKEFTNLPRKANVTITGCLENCVHVETQDIGMYPAVQMTDGGLIQGFNVVLGGKMGSGGFRVAIPLNAFVTPAQAPGVSAEILRIFRDEGDRTNRTRARLAFLIEDWGIDRFREELNRRLGFDLSAAGKDARTDRTSDHLGVMPQKQEGFFSVGLCVPVGRINSADLTELARLADTYGRGEIRLTTTQNAIITWVPEKNIPVLLKEPLLAKLSPDALPVYRGLVSCTGVDYCKLAVIETKGISVDLAEKIETLIPPGVSISMNWSGCPAGCGNHQASDIGFMGTKVKVDGVAVDAVHIYIGGRSGAKAKPGVKIMENVPCSLLPQVIPTLVSNLELLKRIEPEEDQNRRVVMVPMSDSEIEEEVMAA